MTESTVKLPFYVKASLLLIGLYVFISMLSISSDILLPLIYASILAILISPLVSFLVRRKINRAIAVAGVLLLATLVIAFLIFLLSSQANRLGEAWPQLTEKFGSLLDNAIAWASANLNISTGNIRTWIENTKTELINNSGAAIGNTLSTMGNLVATVFLTPVYIFMLLFYQPHLIEFLHKVFGAGNDKKVSEILSETKRIIQSFLIGLFAEVGIVAILNSIGLLILGLDYAILLGILGALLNIIPYLGALITMLIFIAIALVTKAPIYALYVVAMFSFIQIIDNNFIVPKIVGSKVKLNAFFSLLAVIGGAALWGVPGMFLAIPLTAIIKLILDRIEPLKPWGFLLGDTTPPLIKLDLDFKNLSKKLPHFKTPPKNQP